MYKILVVEDEQFLVQVLKDNLESEGYVIDTASDGEGAMVKIRKNRPNIILLDLLMPKKDGFYVLEEVRKNLEWKLIPVLVLSNLGGDAEIKRALAMGADDYFVKSQHPIEEVLEKVKECFFLFFDVVHRIQSGGKISRPFGARYFTRLNAM